MVSKGKIIIATVFLFAIEIANVAVFADESATSQNNRKPSRRIIQVKSEQLKKDLDSGKNFVLIDVGGRTNIKLVICPKASTFRNAN